MGRQSRTQRLRADGNWSTAGKKGGGKGKSGKSGAEAAQARRGPCADERQRDPAHHRKGKGGHERSAISLLAPGEWGCSCCGAANRKYRTRCYKCELPRKEGVEYSPANAKGAGKGNGKNGSGQGGGKGGGKGGKDGDQGKLLREIADLKVNNAKLERRLQEQAVPPAADGGEGDDGEGMGMDMDGDPDELLRAAVQDAVEHLKGGRKLYHDAFYRRFTNAKPDQIAHEVQNANDLVGGPYRHFLECQTNLDKLEAEYRQSRPLAVQRKAAVGKVRKFEEKVERNEALLVECRAEMERIAADGRKKAEEANKLEGTIQSQKASLAEVKALVGEIEASEARVEQGAQEEPAGGGGGEPGSVNQALVLEYLKANPAHMQELEARAAAAAAATAAAANQPEPLPLADGAAAAGGACAAAGLPGIATGDISTVGRTSGSGKVSGPAARALDGERAAAGPYGTHALRGC